jgi:hypothetical protein
MKRFFTLALVGAMALGLSSIAYANFCAFDPVPAASLLFPFVAFDYNNPINGTTTLFAITNVSSDAQIVHVTLWTDYSIAVLDFNIVLSGYDVQTLNIRDILYFGNLPDTGTSGDLIVRANANPPLADGPVNPLAYPSYPYLDPSDGTNSIAARCPSTSPAYPNYPPMDAGLLAQLRAFLSASQTVDRFHDDCAGTEAEIGDWFEGRTAADVTWMYITADVVWTCNRVFPDVSPVYWTTNAADPWSDGVEEDAAGEARRVNVLMGDVFWVNDALRFSEADNAVHLEADLYPENVVTITPDLQPMSFFYLYSTDKLAFSDEREPLPTGWAFRYMGWQDAAVDTWIRAFKKATHTPPVTSYGQVGGDWVWDLDNDYDLTPLVPSSLIAYDCIAYTYFAWDEDENINTTITDPWSFPGVVNYVPNLLPLETQEVNVDQFNMVDDSGWVMFLWPASNWFDGDDAWIHTDWYQTWMGVKYGAYGVYTAGMSGAVMANFNCFAEQVYPGLGIGFEYIDPLDGYVESTSVY